MKTFELAWSAGWFLENRGAILKKHPRLELYRAELTQVRSDPDRRIAIERLRSIGAERRPAARHARRRLAGVGQYWPTGVGLARFLDGE